MPEPLEINGTPVPVAPGTWTEDDEYPVDTTRGYGGVAHHGRTNVTLPVRNLRRVCRFDTPVRPRSVSDAILALLETVPITVSGELVQDTRTGIASEVTVLEAGDIPQATHYALSVTLWLDPPEPES